MMCPIRSPLQFIQTTNEAEPKLRMVFGKGKVQRQEAVPPGVAQFSHCEACSQSNLFPAKGTPERPGKRMWFLSPRSIN